MDSLEEIPCEEMACRVGGRVWIFSRHVAECGNGGEGQGGKGEAEGEPGCGMTRHGVRKAGRVSSFCHRSPDTRRASHVDHASRRRSNLVGAHPRVTPRASRAGIRAGSWRSGGARARQKAPQEVAESEEEPTPTADSDEESAAALPPSTPVAAEARPDPSAPRASPHAKGVRKPRTSESGFSQSSESACEFQPLA